VASSEDFALMSQPSHLLNPSTPNSVVLSSVLNPSANLLTRGGLILGGTFFLALLAQIAIPVPGSPVPVTGQTLGVLLLGSVYGAELGFTTFSFYLLLAIAGAPIFASGAHGLARLSGPTGGYLVGMLIASALTGALASCNWDQKILTLIPTLILGEIVIFGVGLLWLHHSTAQGWSWTLSNGFSPFIIGEILKIAIASITLLTVRRFAAKRK
jgi:biotin transport system substrate-specific component